MKIGVEAGFYGPFDPVRDQAIVAAQSSSGNSLETVVAAARRVEAGEGRFERDGVVFQEDEVNWPVLACILHALAQGRGMPSVVVDFGGGLGSFYRQHRKFFADLPLKWCVVELPEIHAVADEFRDGRLEFHPTVRSVFETYGRIDVGLYSGVFCKVGNIEPVWDDIESLLPAVVVTRHWSSDRPDDEWYVQKTPPEIYESISVFRLFGKGNLEREFERLGFSALQTRAEDEPIAINGSIYFPEMTYWRRDD